MSQEKIHMEDFDEAIKFIGKSCMEKLPPLVDCLDKEKKYSSCEMEVENFKICRDSYWKRIFQQPIYKTNYDKLGEFVDQAEKSQYLRKGYMKCIKYIKYIENCSEFSLFDDPTYQKHCLKYTLDAEICQRKESKEPTRDTENFVACFFREFPENHKIFKYPTIEKKLIEKCKMKQPLKAPYLF